MNTVMSSDLVSSQAALQFLTFTISGEEYAVNLLKAREIIQFDTITNVPRAPEWVRGVINLRGSVVPVIDLAVVFSKTPSAVGKETCIVIVEVQGEQDKTVIGIMADTVKQVIDLLPGDIETPPSFGTSVNLRYLLGMGRTEKKFCLILNTDTLFSASELLDLEHVYEPELESSDSSSGEQLSAATE